MKKKLLRKHNPDEISINESEERINKLIKKYRLTLSEIRRSLKKAGIHYKLSSNDKIKGNALALIIKMGTENIKSLETNSTHVSIGSPNTIKLRQTKEAYRKSIEEKNIPIQIIKIPMGGKPK